MSRRSPWRLAWLLALAGCAAAAAQTGPATDGSGALRVDERRPDQPLTLSVAGTPVQLTGSWEGSAEHRRNFDLSVARPRDRVVIEHEVKVEARWRFAAAATAFLQIAGLHETRRTQGVSGTLYSQALERGQMWLQFERLYGTRWALQLGRVALVDRRAWWWDEDLDAVRLRFDGEALRLSTGLARELARVSSAESGIDPRLRGVMRWFGDARWPLGGRHAIEGFWLLQRDRSGSGDRAVDDADVDARWFGLRASGRARNGAGRLDYHADVALVRGHEQRATGRQPIRGHAVDVGVDWTWSVPLRPSLSIGWARGSSGFRQTGLHENKARISGVKRVRIYGELLQPELANLEVTRVGAGIQLAGNTSLELLWHRYRQVAAAAELAGARLSVDPLGLDRRIGHEIDLVLALREWRHAELILRLARFVPGAAFAPDRRDPANSIELAFELNF